MLRLSVQGMSSSPHRLLARVNSAEKRLTLSAARDYFFAVMASKHIGGIFLHKDPT